MRISTARSGLVAAGTAIAVLGLGALPAGSSAAGAGTPALGLGTYAGKTSQGQAIRFKIVRSKCDSPTPPYAFGPGTCFQGELYAKGDFYPKVLEPCSDGSTYSDPLYAASYKLLLSPSGSLTYRVKGLGSTVTTNGSVSMISLRLSGAKVTGTLHQTESLDRGAGTVSCNSKIVKFTATKA